MKNELNIHKNMESELGKRAIYLQKLQQDFIQKNATYKAKLEKLGEKRNKLSEKRASLLHLKHNEAAYRAMRIHRINELAACTSTRTDLVSKLRQIDAEISALQKEYIKHHNVVVLIHHMLRAYRDRILQQAVYNNKLVDQTRLMKIWRHNEQNFVLKKAFVHLGKFQNDFKQLV